MFGAERLGMVILAVLLLALCIVLSFRGCSSADPQGPAMVHPLDTTRVDTAVADSVMDKNHKNKVDTSKPRKRRATKAKKPSRPLVPHSRDHLGEPAN